MNFGGGDAIRFERRGKAGVVTLARPAALNALTHAMVLALSKALAFWAKDGDVDLVLMTAEGRAFCAGGDVLHIDQARRAGRPTVDFFADEYRLVAQIARFPKPYLSLIDGIVMGGGVGIAIHGSHRVVTERAIMAMPEAALGFFPDVGGSFFLSRLKGSYGLYLGLTGARIRAGEALRAGLATHAVRSGDHKAIIDQLCAGAPIDKTLRRFAWMPNSVLDEASLLTIARLFSRNTLGDLMRGLRQAGDHGDPIAAKSLEAIGLASPTSIAVTFRQIDTGAMLEIDECMRMEFRIANRFLAGADFFEGIRAAVIDKDSSPRWRPASLDLLAEPEIEAYFAPLPGGDLRL